AGRLRAEAARTPADTDLADLAAELATHSEEFAQRWNAHDVECYRSGQQRFSTTPTSATSTSTTTPSKSPPTPG
ncbi:transcriptional regulator, partial [Streptomyces sp. SAS_269]|uniref:MmyB family transcriptional regulator n=1 Tax=Streptomyces sp. SAS_269 TaxID=3412749 RepID=UPI00403D4E73